MSRPRPGPVLIALGALAILGAVALVGSAGSGASSDTPSSRSAGPNGTLALHDYLASLGFSVSRLSGSYDLTGADVDIVVEPETGFTDDETAALNRFLGTGGLLLLATDGAAEANADPLLRSLGIIPLRSLPGGDATPVQPFDPGDTVRTVHVAGRFLDLDTSQAAPLLRIDGHTALAGVKVGRGVAYVLGSPYPVSNEGLRVTRPDPDGTLRSTGSDADRMVLALMERARTSSGGLVHVAVDEIHHGEGSQGGIGAVVVSPAGLAVLLAGVIGVAFLASSGRRLGRPVSPGVVGAVPSAAAYIDAVASLYERSASRGSVANSLASELRDRIAHVTGTPPSLPDELAVERVRPYGEERAARAAATLAEARRLAAGRPSEAELLALGRRVDVTERDWVQGTMDNPRP